MLVLKNDLIYFIILIFDRVLTFYKTVGEGWREGMNLEELLGTKNATLKFLLQNIVPGRYYLYMHLEKNKHNYIFFKKRNFCRKKNCIQKR